MVVSQTRGTPIQIPWYPKFGDIPIAAKSKTLTSGGLVFGRARLASPRITGNPINWAAVKELNLSCYIGETLLISIYIYIPIMVTGLRTATQ